GRRARSRRPCGVIDPCPRGRFGRVISGTLPHPSALERPPCARRGQLVDGLGRRLRRVLAPLLRAPFGEPFTRRRRDALERLGTTLDGRDEALREREHAI